ncbi:helix-turn-helix domain-containing protein [Chryseobacterium paridis]|uniref:Helix-turn-helix transcriptional regulator n=1 Tax=Chryseobacterium paridis TaxID=2800328 RepID=A0ABS1FT52_9FLAO|nr:AraC family transcriptional regulator [Chryseobacterium paridis]MBK1895595.1 helix-turn-helix transcriptional regulator [Chryseobacterium paridis]
MKLTEIQSCYIGPEISPEQFIPEHFFLFLIKGKINSYDGHRNYTMKPGDFCIVRKNRLARYNKEKDNDEFKKIVIIFDEVFLRSFFKKYQVSMETFLPKGAFIIPKKNELITHFINSLQPYYTESGAINEVFSELKREELLLILLQIKPSLSGLFFDFGIPGKIDLEEFMLQNYKFNVSTERFAYLTGRSLSAFKRDFKQIFNDTPGHWLVKKRLEEARFLLEKKHQRPNDIYLDLGFEDLSHFSFAFKKQFGNAPRDLVK